MHKKVKRGSENVQIGPKRRSKKRIKKFRQVQINPNWVQIGSDFKRLKSSKRFKQVQKGLKKFRKVQRNSKRSK